MRWCHGGAQQASPAAQRQPCCIYSSVPSGERLHLRAIHRQSSAVPLLPSKAPVRKHHEKRYSTCQAAAGSSAAPKQPLGGAMSSGQQEQQLEPTPPAQVKQKPFPLILDKVMDVLKYIFIASCLGLGDFLQEAKKLPAQLTYPTPEELLWKGFLIMLSIMTLMVIISTFDTTFLYIIVKLMRRTA